MQAAFDLGQTHALLTVRNQLRRTMEHAAPEARREPIGQLVRSLLGTRTYDAVSRAAYERLIARFPDCATLAVASIAEIESVIADVTFADKKAVHIGVALRMVRARTGGYDLEFLRDWPVEEALRWLEQIHGVGRKIAAATLNFSTLARPAFVIDGHVLRVLKRLGFVPFHATVEAAYQTVMASLPKQTAEDLRELHVLLKRLGQTVCVYDAPLCPQCPLNAICHGRDARQPA